LKERKMKSLMTSIKKHSVWIAVGLVGMLIGCKSSIGTTTSGAAITKADEVFFASVLDRSFRFNTFAARMNLDFSSQQQEFSSRVQVKIIRDDRIQLSIQPVLGIELYRIELSKDSIKMFDRLNKRYVADNYQQLRREMNVDFNFQNLQALLTNRMFIPGENQLTTNHFRQFRVRKNNSTAEFQWMDRNKTAYTFIADSEEKLLTTKIENEPQKQFLTWEYTRFQTVNNQLFPLRMTARLTSDNQLQGSAVLTFSTPEINSPLALDFTIPSGYNRVSLEQIIHSLRTL